ncbi:glycolate oxidase subunit GlcE [Kinneretia asaccharophila]|uniref:Glycolate oxidase FAD binding subunit n=1 Tax=Roseateles asaccharophilus TaxID=582607 RepID=A0A4R6NA87_9BURK|nr:glycolate oxidase subunit GlcE [Roseateles asaccharophilus]MDN3544955.1 glycolate oxidase subunit GlcE [Roseateles asaccharophilus]TDP12659.1 glycolate oxidase FAD binding subunit [Roseateles asaccharophilus]
MAGLTIADLQARVRQAAESGQALCLRGHGSKDFYGQEARGEPLSTLEFAGISAYEPSELVVTAKAGTPIAELEALLASQGQHLPFEPPRFGGRGTVGGMVAAGLSGPARASAGSVRDHVLGLTLINGRGEAMNFGGTVMKNVAGYDVSRLMTGALGVLGLIAEVSIKVLPLPVASATLRFEMEAAEALQALNRWGGKPLPLQASACWDGALILRLAGAEAAVAAAQRSLGGELIPQDLALPFWTGLRDQSDEFFLGAERAVQGGARLWRLSVPQTAPVLNLPGEQLIEWGGAQRWLTTPAADAQVREAAAAVGGHATLYRAADKAAGVFAPLSAPLMRIHRDLKKAFDPHAVFNPGRLYGDL